MHSHCSGRTSEKQVETRLDRDTASSLAKEGTLRDPSTYNSDSFTNNTFYDSNKKRSNKLNLDKQRCALTDQGNYDFNLRLVQAENTVQILRKELRQQDQKLKIVKTKTRAVFTLTELRSRQRAHRETLSYLRDDVKKLRKTRRSEAELREEAYQDAVSQEGGKHSGH